VGWVLISEKPQSGRRRFWTYAEGNMRRNDTARSGAVLRSRRPQCTPRNFLHENRETSEAPVGAVLRRVPRGEAPGTFPIGSGVSDRTAGEGFGRKTRGQATEESHIGIKEGSNGTCESPEQGWETIGGG